MINILCVCGNGMGTSTLLKINVRKSCAEKNIEANVESCSFGEALSFLPNTDLILTSPEWADMIPATGCVMATTENLIDVPVVTETLLKAVREHFPDELKE